MYTTLIASHHPLQYTSTIRLHLPLVIRLLISLPHPRRCAPSAEPLLPSPPPPSLSYTLFRATRLRDLDRPFVASLEVRREVLFLLGRVEQLLDVIRGIVEAAKDA